MEGQMAKVAPATQESTPVEQIEKPSLKPLGVSDQEYSQHLYNHLNIKDSHKHDKEVNEYIGTIIKWSGADNLTDAIIKINELSLKLGQPPSGMDRLTQLFNWSKLSLQIRKMEAIRESYGNPT